MFLEEIPYDFTGVYVPARLADGSFGQVLVASGPGVSAADDGVENHLGPLSALAIDLAPHTRPVFRIPIGFPDGHDG